MCMTACKTVQSLIGLLSYRTLGLNFEALHDSSSRPPCMFGCFEKADRAVREFIF